MTFKGNKHWADPLCVKLVFCAIFAQLAGSASHFLQYDCTLLNDWDILSIRMSSKCNAKIATAGCMLIVSQQDAEAYSFQHST